MANNHIPEWLMMETKHERFKAKCATEKIQKFDANGNYVFAIKIGGTGSDVGNGMLLDASGNIFITGYFNSTADFDPSAGTANLTSLGSNDIFIAKC